MYRNYKLGKRIVACILLMSLFLQSCLDSTIPSGNEENREQLSDRETPIRKKQTEEIRGLSSSHQGPQVAIDQREKTDEVAGEDLWESTRGDYSRHTALVSHTDPQRNLICYIC